MKNMNRKPLSKEYLELTEIWNNTTKDVIVRNVERFLIIVFPECENFTSRQYKLMEITGSKKDAVYAWLNNGRSNVKVPLYKLCMIAAELNVDVMEFLK